MPLHPIFHRPDPVRHPNPPCRGAVKCCPLRFRQIPAGAGVDVGAVGQVRRVDAVKLAAGAVAGIQQPHFGEFVKIPVVNGAARALGRRLPVVVQTQPAQVFPEDLRVFLTGSLGIQILHPENHFSALRAHGQPCNQRREDVAQVHPPGRSGGEAPYGLQLSHLIHHQMMPAIPASSPRSSSTRPPEPFFRCFFRLLRSAI